MATLKELAKELKVSVSTVSKALHDSPEISVSTIEKVKELAKKRNYKPNKIALSLKSNRTLTIGVVIPDILNRFYSKVLDGIHDSADKHGYDVITITTKESIIKEIDSLQILSTGNVDGVALSSISSRLKTFSGFEASKANNSNSFLGSSNSFLSLMTLYSSRLMTKLPNLRFFGASSDSLKRLNNALTLLTKTLGFTGLVM